MYIYILEDTPATSGPISLDNLKRSCAKTARSYVTPGCSPIRGRPPRCAAKAAHQLHRKVRCQCLPPTRSRPSVQSKSEAQGSPPTLPKSAPPRPPTNSAEECALKAARQPSPKVFTKVTNEQLFPQVHHHGRPQFNQNMRREGRPPTQPKRAPTRQPANRADKSAAKADRTHQGRPPISMP